MRLRHAALVVGCAPLLASCIFLLDYDELQGSPASTGGTAGAPTSPGGASSGGAGGAAPSCGDCNDDDPCTIDTCLALPGEEPECQHAPTEGLKLDGFETSLRAEQHVRVALIGSGKLFYLSALEVNDGVPQVSLYRFADDGAELEPIAANLRLEGVPVSNVGLATEEVAAGQVALHGFVAVKAKLNESATRVLHLECRDDAVTSKLVGLSYRSDNPTLFPQALAMGGEIVGAWIQEDGTIAVHEVGAGRTETFGEASLPATTLSLLSTREQRPAVLFTAQADEAPLGSWVETLGGQRTQLEECLNEPGAYLSSSVIATQLPGIWLANVTRTGDDYLTTAGGTIVCGADCAAVPNDCDPDAAPSGIRNVAGATVHFDADEAGIVYSVVAVPQLAPRADGSGLEAKLAVALGWADFSSDPVKTRDVGSLEVAKSDASAESGFAGPDWPAVAILPGRRAAVAWIAPDSEGNGTELHVQRYKMCLGEP
ncbi:MAG: hypothetical protein EOO73_34385 [Myxococcales bacterium]|nr:MAG: hypothetical protein EOO73_34385 [Myxococcales bacterium]